MSPLQPEGHSRQASSRVRGPARGSRGFGVQTAAPQAVPGLAERPNPRNSSHFGACRGGVPALGFRPQGFRACELDGGALGNCPASVATCEVQFCLQRRQNLFEQIVFPRPRNIQNRTGGSLPILSRWLDSGLAGHALPVAARHAA